MAGEGSCGILEMGRIEGAEPSRAPTGERYRSAQGQASEAPWRHTPARPLLRPCDLGTPYPTGAIPCRGLPVNVVNLKNSAEPCGCNSRVRSPAHCGLGSDPLDDVH